MGYSKVYNTFLEKHAESKFANLFADQCFYISFNRRWRGDSNNLFIFKIGAESEKFCSKVKKIKTSIIVLFESLNFHQKFVAISHLEGTLNYSPNDGLFKGVIRLF